MGGPKSFVCQVFTEGHPFLISRSQDTSSCAHDISFGRMSCALDNKYVVQTRFFIWMSPSGLSRSSQMRIIIFAEHRLTGATVRVGLNSDILHNMICGSAVTLAQAQPGAWIEFVCTPPTWARYVSVDISSDLNTHWLQLCEVLVNKYVRKID